MANQRLAKLSLVPVDNEATAESFPGEAPVSQALSLPSERLDHPESQTRVSPRAIADGATHHSIASVGRLTRESFASGDWTVIDVHRSVTEVRVILRAAAVVLSAREREVLRAVLAGESDRDISQKLGITRQCVCGHLANALVKLGTESRFTALSVWRALGEAERGRTGRAQVAEISYGGEKLLSLRSAIPPRPEIEVRLSSAETQVAWLVCDGLSNRDIAFARGSAERTVANQVAAIFTKLGCSRRFDVAQFLLGLR